MKSQILISTFNRGNNRSVNRLSRAKFQSMINEEKTVDRLRLDDNKIDWYDDGPVESLKIGSVKVPHRFYHMIEEPTGFKSKRDLKHLRMVQRLQKKERIHVLKKKVASSKVEPPRKLNYQLRLSEKIKDCLNDILTNDVIEFPDPREENSRDSIVNSVLLTGSPRFINVTLTSDHKIARCTWESFPNYEILVRDQLSIYKKKLRRMIAARIQMKFIPHLVFQYNEKKIVSQDADRLMNKIEDDMAKPEKVPQSAIKMGPGLTPQEKDEKMKYYMESFYNFNLTRQTLLAPFEQKLHAALEQKLAKKKDAKKLLFEKGKIQRFGKPQTVAQQEKQNSSKE